MDIELRVARLERSLRRWKVAACLGAVVAVGVAARPQGKTIYAEKFIVESPEGVFRAVFGTKIAGENDNSIGMYLRDRKGDIQASMEMTRDDEPEFALTGKGRSEVSLNCWKDRGPFLILRNEKGEELFSKP